jgi:hypothetical protein
LEVSVEFSFDLHVDLQKLEVSVELSFDLHVDLQKLEFYFPIRLVI